MAWGRFKLGGGRSEGFQSAALALGLAFDPEPPFEIARFDHGLAAGNHGRGASNVVHGRYRGRGVTVFDWTAHTRTPTFLELAGIRSAEHADRATHQTVVAVDLPRPPVALELVQRPRRVRHATIPIGHPGLDAAFICRSFDAAAAVVAPALATEPFAGFLLATEGLQGVTLRRSHLSLVLARCDPAILPDLVEFGIRVADALPPGVLDTRDGDLPPGAQPLPPWQGSSTASSAPPLPPPPPPGP